MTTADQKSAPSNRRWSIIVGGGLALLLGLLLVQYFSDEPEQQYIPTHNNTVRDLVGPTR
jgi:hypothetical protein